jgi:hypothetical protein
MPEDLSASLVDPLHHRLGDLSDLQLHSLVLYACPSALVIPGKENIQHGIFV